MLFACRRVIIEVKNYKDPKGRKDNMRRAITVLPENRILYGEDGTLLLSLLQRNGFVVPAACGGRGTCGKCRVKLLSGSVAGALPDRDGFVLSCRARVVSDLVIEYTAQATPKAAPHRSHKDVGTLGAVLDLGTTTLAMRIYDLANGECLAESTALNPQGTYGADVLSRIGAYARGEGATLQRLVLEKVKEMLEASMGGSAHVKRMTVAANPTMLHLFWGVDPTPIGTYPFTPAFRDTQRIKGEDLALPVDEVILLPFSHAYVGSDITAGILACRLCEHERSALLIDLGTNGETVLYHNKKLLAASAAAGPAMEGATIECGTGGVAGAISHVRFENGKLHLETVEKKPAVGICGSGLCDLVALLVCEGLIDENGTFDKTCESALASRLTGDRFYLSDSVYLSQADVREFQLAKAAIAASIKALLHEAGASPNDVGQVYIAGGMGFHIDPESAISVGLLPRFENARVTAIGNASLLGGELCLFDPQGIRRAELLAQETKHLELSFSKVFEEAYIKSMTF